MKLELKLTDRFEYESADWPCNDKTVDASDRRAWRLQHLDELNSVQDEVLARMEELKYLPRDQYSVLLGLLESVVNAFKHGNKMQPEKSVIIDAAISADHAWFRIQDEGDGFDVEAVPDPTLPENVQKAHGRGIFMMRAFLDRVTYYGSGNIVTICKYRSRDEEAA